MTNGGISPLEKELPKVDPAVDYEEEKKKQVARDFESIFIHQLLDKMKDTIPEEESEDGASGQIKNMYWSFMAQAVSDKGGLGMWKNIYNNMLKDTDVSHANQITEKLNEKA